MKRKRLDRDIWTFDKYPYYQMHIDMDDFHGLVCLIQLLGGVAHVNDGQYQYWERPKAGKVAICGKGMTWLQLIPDGKSHVLTAKYLPNNSVSIWYADIIENIEYDSDGVAVFIDKYLDVTFTPQGDVSVDDRDELDAALQSGDITKEQFNSALIEGDYVVETYCTDIAKTEVNCNKILSYVLEKIRNGEHKFNSKYYNNFTL
jgi:predicted RNA-binding protein associated with RNAse of E/G family